MQVFVEQIGRRMTGGRLGASCSSLLAAFVLAMLMNVVFTTSTAKAACNDYVVISNPSSDAVVNQRPMAAHPDILPGQKAPCDGPQCRGQSPLPIYPPATVAGPVNDLLVHTFVNQPLTPLASARSVLEQWAIDSEDHSFGVDPPPRDFISIL